MATSTVQSIAYSNMDKPTESPGSPISVDRDHVPSSEAVATYDRSNTNESSHSTVAYERTTESENKSPNTVNTSGQDVITIVPNTVTHHREETTQQMVTFSTFKSSATKSTVVAYARDDVNHNPVNTDAYTRGETTAVVHNSDTTTHDTVAYVSANQNSNCNNNNNSEILERRQYTLSDGTLLEPIHRKVRIEL